MPTFAQFSCPFLTVFGALLGKQDGRSIEILNSFELQFDQIDDDVVINLEYYRAKEEQCEFTLQIFLIWFTNCVMQFLHHCFLCKIFSLQFITVRQVFKDLDFFGWYTTGGSPSINDVKVHKQVSCLK